jgi:hypothetical protein
MTIQPKVPLAELCAGGRKDYSSLLLVAETVLQASDPQIARGLCDLEKCLTLLGRSFYAGHLTVVDKFCQLYTIGTGERAAYIENYVEPDCDDERPTAPRAEPLTAHQIDILIFEARHNIESRSLFDQFHAIARAVEVAHGIGGAKP